MSWWRQFCVSSVLFPYIPLQLSSHIIHQYDPLLLSYMMMIRLASCMVPLPHPKHKQLTSMLLQEMRFQDATQGRSLEDLDWLVPSLMAWLAVLLQHHLYLHSQFHLGESSLSTGSPILAWTENVSALLPNSTRVIIRTKLPPTSNPMNCCISQIFVCDCQMRFGWSCYHQ